MNTLIDRLRAHLAQMAPHQKQRQQGILLQEALSTLAVWEHQRLVLARLASETPEFYNPLVVYEAKKLRDVILLEERSKAQ